MFIFMFIVRVRESLPVSSVLRSIKNVQYIYSIGHVQYSVCVLTFYYPEPTAPSPPLHYYISRKATFTRSLTNVKDNGLHSCVEALLMHQLAPTLTPTRLLTLFCRQFIIYHPSSITHHSSNRSPTTAR